MTISPLSPADLSRIFEATPNPYLLLRADPPGFTIVAVNEAYLSATGTKREAMLGRGLFDVFPDNPDDASVSGVSDLRSSLERVLRDKAPDAMGVQKYDIPLRDGSGRFEVKYWSPINSPVANGEGRVDYIIHRVEDVTEFMLAREREDAEQKKRVETVQAKAERMEAEVLRGGAELKSANRELKQVLERLAEANTKLKELDRIKTEFFSNVSHEFRTPLTLLIGPLEELLRSDSLVQEDGRVLAETAHRGALRLLKLVNALLDFSRLEAGRADLHFETTDLAMLTAEAASNFQSACEEAGLKLSIDCPSPLPVQVDRDMWEKIVLNLISNAFKFTFEGEISVSLRAVGGQAQLTVRDSGVGIPESELTRIFDRFHRVRGQRSRAYEGSGIGLALVKELVGLHGGAIEARNGPKGAIFTVTIPIVERVSRDASPARPRPASTGAEAYVQEARRWLPEAERGEKDGGVISSAAGKKAGPLVLLIEDNPDMRSHIGRILEEAGYRVTLAVNADAALAAIDHAKLPDLVLSDVMMPGRLDGFGLIRELRKDARTETLPIVLLSARAGEEARVEGLAAGADEYIVKPFGSRELIARIDAAIRLAEMRREAAARERELEVARAEAKFLQAMDAAQMGEIVVDLNTETAIHTPAFAKLFGYPPERRLSLTEIMDSWHPDDRAKVISERDAAILGGAIAFETEYRIVWPDGTKRWLTGRGRIKRDPSGAAVEVSVIYMDTTERKWVEEKQNLLLAELNHRVKNTLAAVQSIALQSRLDKPTPEVFGQRFEARLGALASAHDLLTQAAWEGASLAEAVKRTLAPHMRASQGVDRAAERVTIDGPAVQLDPNAAVTLHMALHELATNAAKYGALSAPHGRLDVRWSVDRSVKPAAVEFVWAERGGPVVAPPTRRGFGLQLVEKGLERELDGEVSLRFDPEGLTCKVRLPASAKVAPL